MLYCAYMKKLLLALALGTALVTPSFAFADIGPEPWEQTVAPYYESVEQELVTEPVFDHPYRNENTYWAEVRTEPPTETESMLTQFPRALYLTVLIECIVAFVVLGALKLSRRIVLSRTTCVDGDTAALVARSRANGRQCRCVVSARRW